MVSVSVDSLELAVVSGSCSCNPRVYRCKFSSNWCYVQQRTELKVEIFEKLWPMRRQRVAATGGDEPSKRASTRDVIADATAEVVRKYHQRLLSAQPDIADTALSSEELAAKVKANLKDLLVKFQKYITPASPSFKCATHVRFLVLLTLFVMPSGMHVATLAARFNVRTSATLWRMPWHTFQVE